MIYKTKIPDNIARKISRSAIFSYLIIAICVAAIQLSVEYFHEKSIILNEIESIEKSFGPGISKALWTYNETTLKSILIGLNEIDMISGLSLSNRDGDLIESLGAIPETIDQQDKKFIQNSIFQSFNFNYPLFIQEDDGSKYQLGTLILYSSPQIIFDRISFGFIFILINTIVITFLLFTIFYYLINKQIIRPLVRLTNFVDSVDTNDLSPINTDVEIDAGNEIKKLNQTFITMINELSVANHKVTKNEKRYRNMMEAMTDPVYICSPDKKISYMNSAMIKRIGCDMTGESCHKNLHNLDKQCDWCVFDKIREGKTNEITIVSPLDNRTYRITNMPVEYDEQLSKMSIYKDITDYLNAVSEKEQVTAELIQVQKMESIGKLAGGIAHDFNNILYPIIGFTQLSQNELPNDHPVQENLTDILDGAIRASDLVKRILYFSRQKDPELKPKILQPVIKEAQKLLRSTIPTNIDLLLKLYDGQDAVLCDESEIHEIILNLCTNAYHAIAGDQGQIIINLDRQNPPIDLDLPQGEYLCLSVEDNGIGIPEKIKDKIFEPYITTKEIGKGSGLGLSVVYGIVENYTGGIKVESSPRTGTVFEIYLPITKQSVTIEKSHSFHGSDKKREEHVLFVDDEKSIVKLGARALQNSGYRVTGIKDSTEALKLFEANPEDYDLIISDMAMPGMVGSELAKRILDIRPGIPIIICSGYSEKLDKMKAKGLNVSAFLDKPLDIETLVNSTREVLSKHMTK